MESFTVLHDIYEGRPIAVLGGGPNLPGDLLHVPEDAILISLNHHATYLRDCHYIAFVDTPDAHPELLKATNDYIGRRITNVPGYSDYDMYGVQYWQGGGSGMFATWVASYMGGDPVLLCGINCFQSNPPHFHETEKIQIRKSGWHGRSVEYHISKWSRCFDRCPNPHRIKAVSGPLTKIF